MNGLPLEILGLPARPYNALRRSQVCTVQDLVYLSERDLLGIRGMGRRSVEQVRSALSRVGLSLGHPMVMTGALLEVLQEFRKRSEPEQLLLDFRERSLQELITWWFSDLSEDQLEVLLLRYGIKGAPLSVEEVAYLLGGTPLQVVAIEARALQKIARTRHRPVLDPIAGYLLKEISETGGLIAEPDLASRLQRSYPSEEIRPIGVARLIMRLYEDFARIPGEDVWGLVECPLVFVPAVRSFIGSIWQQLPNPVPLDQLLQQVREHWDQVAQPVSDDFLLACIRTDSRVEIDEYAMCSFCTAKTFPRSSPMEPSLDLLLEAWFSPCDDRDRQVVWGRYGLADGRRRTLEECGQIIGVTRERVRQIERRCLKGLAFPHRAVMISGIVDALQRMMRSAGGLMTEEEVGRYLASAYRVEQLHPTAVGRLLLHVFPRFKEVLKGYLWGLPEAPVDLVVDVQAEMAHILESACRPLFPSELIARFRRTSLYQSNQRLLSDNFVGACLRTHREIERDGENRCVLRGWSRTHLDEVVQALHEIGQPAHFGVITERANTLLPPGQRVLASTVRAYMERRADIFVSLGRGMYWLRDHISDNDTVLPENDLALGFERLARWQAEFDGRGDELAHDTHAEVEKIRRAGLGFFSK